ncbi:MAG TPA: hypothetical protein VNF51_01680 [Candidatus Paceibacterota bacterium]|nr:hypothetical protein [Candidatus Paceibacterota bacterium]
MKIKMFFGPDPYVIQREPTNQFRLYQFRKGNVSSGEVPKPMPLLLWFTPIAIREPSLEQEDAAYGKTYRAALNAFLAKEYPNFDKNRMIRLDEIPDVMGEMPFRIEYRGPGRVAHLIFVRLLQGASAVWDNLSRDKTNNFVGFGTTVKEAADMALRQKNPRRQHRAVLGRSSRIRSP